MKTIRILLLGVGGNVSQGILKAIRHSGLDHHIVGACVFPDTAGLFLCDRALVSPYAAEEEFPGWLYQTCVQERIDIVLSGVEEIIETIAPLREDLFRQTGAVFRASSPEKLAIGRDKYRTCRWLTDHGFPAPACCLSGDRAAAERLLETCGAPLIAKPRLGKSSQGVFLIQSQEALARAAGMGDLVIQECVGSSDREYTVGCYRGIDGFSPPPIVMRRELKDGTSWKVEVVRDPAIEEAAAQICRAFQPDGPLNIQLRLDKNGCPVPFEFNVRFSGTTPMRAQFGFCDVKAMLLETILRQKIDGCFSVRKGTAYRYTNELYVFEKENSFESGTAGSCAAAAFTDSAGMSGV